MDKLNLYYTESVKNRFKGVYEKFEKYSASINKDIYFIDKILGQSNKNEISNERNFALVVMSGYKIVLVMNNENNDDYNDFIDDIDYLSKIYNYISIIGRKREWNDLFVMKNASEFEKVLDEESFEALFDDCKIDKDRIRTGDLIISLIINSINDVEVVTKKEKPKDLLEEVKNKIVLFDTQQSGFIFDIKNDKTIYLQGLAGTGKTELLLHKMKEKYTEDKKNIIAFVCYNTALANDIKKRIPKFFNLLKVTEQIEWGERLFVFNSWGSKDNQGGVNRGLYGYICNKYNIHFARYENGVTFDNVCRNAINDLKRSDKFNDGYRLFDYIFIDESQDFNSSFIELCDMVINRQMFIAGDIFQNIFDNLKEGEIRPNYLLNKCYRTSPNTLMFAHSIGLGLQEKPVLKWLTDDEWESFGYDFEKNKNKYIFSRKTIRRFSGDEQIKKYESVKYEIKNYNLIINTVIDIIGELKKEYDSVEPNDIGIVFLGESKKVYTLIDELRDELMDKYRWDSSIGYVTKERKENAVYISNKNNVKGLEFPFVICIIVDSIKDTPLYRNSLYMILTRSFLTSYLVVENNDCNRMVLDAYNGELKELNENSTMTIVEPNKNEIMDNSKILNDENLNINYGEIIDEILEKYDEFDLEMKNNIKNAIEHKLAKNNRMDKNDIENYIEDFKKLYLSY